VRKTYSSVAAAIVPCPRVITYSNPSPKADFWTPLQQLSHGRQQGLGAIGLRRMDPWSHFGFGPQGFCRVAAREQNRNVGAKGTTAAATSKPLSPGIMTSRKSRSNFPGSAANWSTACCPSTVAITRAPRRSSTFSATRRTASLSSASRIVAARGSWLFVPARRAASPGGSLALLTRQQHDKLRALPGSLRARYVRRAAE